MKKVRTTCPYCGVGCGLVANVTDGRLASVEGDRLHRVNRGGHLYLYTRPQVHGPQLTEFLAAADPAPVSRRGGTSGQWLTD